MRIKYAVNKEGKDKSWNYEKLATGYVKTEGTIFDVQNDIKSGYALAAGYFIDDGRRGKVNFAGSQWILLDIDNKRPVLDENGKKVKDEQGKVVTEYSRELLLEEALNHPFIQRYCALIYTSASHTEEWHRFRLVFVLPEAIEDIDEYESLVVYLQGQLPHDPSCKDAARPFYGNSNAIFPLVNPGASLPEAWVKEAKNAAIELKQQREARLKIAEQKRKEYRDLAAKEGWDTDVMVQQALSFIPPRDIGSGNYDECKAVLMALHDYYGESVATQIAEQWSPSIRGTSWNIDRKMRSFRKEGIGIGSLFEIAKGHGFKYPERQHNWPEGILNSSWPASPPIPDTVLSVPDAAPPTAPISEVELLEQAVQEYLKLTRVSAKVLAAKTIKKQYGLSNQDFQELCADLAPPPPPTFFHISEPSTVTGKDFMDNVLDLVAGEKLPAIPTGFPELDEKIVGLFGGEVYIIAGRPSMGKSALVGNIIWNIAKQDHNVLLFSMEMTADKWKIRAVAADTKINSMKITTGNLNSTEVEKVLESAAAMYGLPIYVDESPGISVEKVRANYNAMAATVGAPKVIVIDYVTLMRAQYGQGDPVGMFTQIANQLQALAKELNVAMVLLSQLSRACESRNDKRPMGSDLRDTGAWEQIADLIIGLYRDEVYNEETQDLGIAELIITKGRNFGTGTVKLAFQPQYLLFESLVTSTQYSPAPTVTQWASPWQ